MRPPLSTTPPPPANGHPAVRARRFRPADGIAAAVVVGVVLAISWPHWWKVIRPDPITARVVDCHAGYFMPPLYPSFTVTVELRNRTGHSHSFSLRDPNGQVVRKLIDGTYQTRFTLGPHVVGTSKFGYLGSSNDGCKNQRFKVISPR